MANKKNATTAAPLPSLDSIESVEPSTVPSGPALSDAEIALTDKIIAATENGTKLARGGSVKTRAEAQTIAARMRRLVTRRLAALGGDVSYKVGTAIPATADGHAWAIRLTVVTPEEAAADAAEAEGTAEGDAPAAEGGTE